MLLNLTNHPSSQWETNQLQAANCYGEIVDMPFPAIDAAAPETEIERTVLAYFQEIKRQYNSLSTTVHIMGELTFCFALIKALQAEGFTCIASTATRNVTEPELGKKLIEFDFVRFRNYSIL